jgi:4-hydroxybenzoyl-CoA thioesterase
VPLRFAHCDPAGIAFYPRLMEICDGVVEDWTAEVIGASRRVMHLEMGLALPTVDLRATFAAPCRLGDLLDISLDVTRVGQSSIGLSIRTAVEGEARFEIQYIQVLSDLAKGRSVPWPDEWRRRILGAAEKENAA